MAAPVGYLQVLPPGLVGFLQIKGVGTNPQSLGDVLQPVLHLTDWYLQGNGEAISAGPEAIPIALNSSGTFTAGLTVPNGQFWAVHNYACNFAAGAGGVLTGARAALFRSHLGLLDIVETSDQVSLSVAGGRDFVSLRHGESLFLRPGDALGWEALQETVAAGAVSGFAYITRLTF